MWDLTLILWLELVRQCKPFKVNDEYHVPLDDASVEVFDNSYYKDLMQARGLLATDEAIMNDTTTKSLVQQYANNQDLFFEGFKRSMIKMSNINYRIYNAILNLTEYDISINFLLIFQRVIRNFACN